MNTPALQPKSDGTGTCLRERCATLGLSTWRFDSGFNQTSAPLEDGPAGDWLRSPFIRRQIIAALRSREPQSGDAPAADELFPGCWMIVIDQYVRRRLEGHLVAIALTPDVLSSEQFEASCQAARLDSQVARARIAALPQFDEDEVARLALLIGWLHDDAQAIGRSAAEISNVSQQLGESYEEISLLYTLGRSMNELAHPGNFVRLACDELRATMSFRWVAAVFIQDAEAAHVMAGRSFVSGEQPCDDRSFNQAALRILANISGDGSSIIEANERGPLGKGRAQVLANPIRHDSRIVGALFAGDKEGIDEEVSSVDMKPLENAAGFVSVLLDNAFLYEEQQRTFLGTLEALTASIDAKDPYTCGHSERVAEVAHALSIKAGLAPDEANRVRVAGLVHDIGKIGVPETVLSKPGRLTNEEFDLIKLHPQIGHDILKDIPALGDVLPGVLYHHERFDGRGYPSGLAGEDIPLMARILGLADSFDAMSSTRTYRAAMHRSKTIEEIRQNAGTQFDPDLAEVFLRLDLEFYDEMVLRHQKEAENDDRGSLRRSGSSGVVARVAETQGGGQAA